MFGLNEITGKSFFKGKDKLMVSTMFFTLQGEGPLMGRPALFVRLAKCNLQCSWCDAFYEDGDWFTPEEIILKAREIINKYFNDDLPNCYAFNEEDKQKTYLNDRRNCAFIVTGGEPTLQNENLYKLLEMAEDEYEWTQIESNGILEPNIPDSTILVVSPKCKEDVDINGGFKRFIPVEYMRPNKRTLKRVDALKFIMENPENLKTPYNSIPSWAFKNREERGTEIYCSPMCVYMREPEKASIVRKNKTSGRLSNQERVESDEVVSFWEAGLIDMKAFQKNHEYAAKYAIEHGCRFQMQMHLFASLA